MFNQKGFIPILVIVVLVVSAVGGYFLYQQQTKSPSSQLATNQVTNQATSAGQIDETANWKTYTDQSLGFQIMYPPDWKVKQGGDPRTTLKSVTVYSSDEQVFLDINFAEEPFIDGSLEKFRKGRIAKGEKWEETSINGIPAMVNISSKNAKTYALESKSKGQLIMILAFEENTKFLPKILATFKYY